MLCDDDTAAQRQRLIQLYAPSLNLPKHRPPLAAAAAARGNCFSYLYSVAFLRAADGASLHLSASQWWALEAAAHTSGNRPGGFLKRRAWLHINKMKAGEMQTGIFFPLFFLMHLKLFALPNSKMNVHMRSGCCQIHNTNHSQGAQQQNESNNKR